MKIRRLYINGFGKFNNQVFNLKEDNQLIFGDNESGKSTLYHFIRTILFGFPKKRDMVRDFTPVEGATYGGHIIVDHPIHGELYIERFKEKNKGQAYVRLEDGRVGDEHLLMSLITPLTKEVFDEVFSFQQEQLIDLNELNEVRLQRLLLTVGLTGSERLTAISNDFLKDRQQIYKPSGRIPLLNQQLKEFNRLEQSIRLVEEQENTYRAKWNRRLELEKLLEKEKKELEDSMSLEKTLLEQQKYFPLYTEWQTLNQETGGSSTEQAPKTTVKSVSEALQEYKFLTKKETELLENQSDIIKDITPAVQFYLENQELFDQLLDDQLSVQSISERQEVLQQQLDAYTSSKKELYDKYRLSNALLDVVIEDKEEESLKELAEAEEELLRKQVILSNERSRLSIRQRNLDKELSKSENQLSIPSMSHSEDGEIDEAPFFDSFTIKMFSGLSLAIAVMMLLLAIVLGLSWLYVIVAAFVGLGVFGFIKANKVPKYHPVTPEEAKSIYKQQLNEADQLADELNDLEKNLAIFNEQEALVNKQKEQWVTAYGFPMDETVSMWLTTLPVFSQLRDIQKNEQEMTLQLATIDKAITSYKESLSFAKDWIPLEGKNIRESFKEVKQFADTQKEAINRLEGSETNNIQSELASIRHQKSACQTLINELTNQHESTPIDVAKEWLNRQEQLGQNANRIDELERQLENVFDLSKNYNLLSINKSLMKLKAEQDEHKDQEKAYQTEWQQIDYDMKQMEKNGSLDDLRQERATQLSKIEEMTEQWLTLRFSEELVQRLFQYLSDQQLPTLLGTVTGYFNLLTNKTYHKVLVEDGQLIIVDNHQRQWKIDQLSTGTKDQLYMAFRLAFIHLHSEDYGSPIIIDDGWLHFDDTRKVTLFKLLDMLGKDNQVICLTSDTTMRDYFETKDKSVLVIGKEETA